MKEFFKSIEHRLRQFEGRRMDNAKVMGYNTKSKIVYWFCVIWWDLAWQRYKFWGTVFHIT